MMLALQRSSTIAIATRHPCFVPCLRSFSTETSKPETTDVFPPSTSSTAAATGHPYRQTTTKWMDDAFPKGDPPRGRGYPRVSFPGSRRLEIPKYRLHCKSNNNNTIITFTNDAGKTIAWQSGGKCAFKGASRASYEAGYQSAVRIFSVIERLAEEKDISVALFFKGFGQGREALKTALLAVEGQYIRPLICSVTDRTPIKIGGTRSKKMRRL